MEKGGARAPAPPARDRPGRGGNSSRPRSWLLEEQQEGDRYSRAGPEPPAQPLRPLEELEETLQLQLPEALLSHLADRGITTLADTAGGIRHIPDLPLPPDYPAVRTLGAHARLGALSDDIELNEQLIGHNFSGRP